MQTLAQHVERHGPLAVRNAIGWVLRAALAVWEIHATGKAHGNIHAGAILIDGEDCRGAGLLLPASSVDPDPLYHSIARIDGMGATLRDDLWGLSVTLYFALTGRMPFPKGIAEALEGGRFRAPPPLAVLRAELDVMQPLLDRFLRVDDPQIATAVEQLVFAIQDFSPTIADLQPLPLGEDAADAETSSPRPAEVAVDARSPTGPRRGPSPRDARRSQLAIGLVGCGVVFLALSIYASGPRGAGDEAASSGTAPTAVAPPTTVTASPASSRAVGAPSGSAADVPVAPPASSEAEPPSPPVAGATEDLVACMAAMFPDDAFEERKRAADFPCRERDAAELRNIITAALVRGGGGKATKAAREWTRLGWYQLAAIAIARSHCCSSAVPIETPPLLDLCAIDEALGALGTTTRSGTDEEVADALDAYRLAIQCAVTAGGGGFFGQDEPPTTQQAAVFLGIVRRVRARRSP